VTKITLYGKDNVSSMGGRKGGMGGWILPPPAIAVTP